MTTDILVVDDEEWIVSVLTRALIARGYAVRVSTSGADALVALGEAYPDVMLLDVNLPDITGWEVLRRLAPDERRRIGVIVFSASPLAPSRVAEFEPDGVLLKPFPMDALLRLIDDVVAQRRAPMGGASA